MKELIKRLREYEANAKADEHFIFDFQEAAGEEMPKLLDYIESLERRLGHNIQLKDNALEIIKMKEQRIKELEATIAKHERREDSHVKQIEKLEAVADAAKETATRLYKYGTDRSEWESSLDRLCETLKEAGKL